MECESVSSSSEDVAAAEVDSAVSNCFRTYQVFVRIRIHGSPLNYNNFLDETLGTLLRDIAVYAHRSSYNRRAFSLLELQGRLETNVHMAVTGDSIYIISGI